MFRRQPEQRGSKFTDKSNVELKIGDIHDKRGKKIKEGLKERQAEGEKKLYRIDVFFAGGGAPGGPGNRDTELRIEDREAMASGMLELTGAEEFALTDTGIKLVFRGRFEGNKEAVRFGKSKMSDIESSEYGFSIGRESVKGTGSNSGRSEDRIEVLAYD